MRGLVAAVTSCIGGKEERYAIKVKPAAPRAAYFVFKRMRDFEELWAQLERLVQEIKQRELASPIATSCGVPIKPAVSAACRWLASFVDRYAFQTIVQNLREQGVETITTLNILVTALVRHVTSMYVEATILRCGCTRLDRQLALIVRTFLEFRAQEPRKDESPTRKRQWVEVRPEEPDAMDAPTKRMMPMFPCHNLNKLPSTKARRLSSVAEEGFMVPPIRKVELAVPMSMPVPARRRGFAEVEFSI